ncbi:MAG: tellurite resistance TerB family protein [Desulfopila sp.]
MADINKILGQLMGSGAAGGFAGGLAGSLASNMLTSKKGRKLGKEVLKMGGIAAVGALAYGAFQKYNSSQTTPLPARQQQAAPPLPAPPEGSPFLPTQNNVQARQNLGLALIRAMIAAARSDGRLDAQESQAIFQRMEALDLAADERDLLIQEMGRPVDMDAIVQSATSQEIAAEIYLASLLAIDVDTVEEQSYLGMLAARMRLPKELVTELHAQVASYTAPVA